MDEIGPGVWVKIIDSWGMDDHAPVGYVGQLTVMDDKYGSVQWGFIDYPNGTYARKHFYDGTAKKYMRPAEKHELPESALPPKSIQQITAERDKLKDVLSRLINCPHADLDDHIYAVRDSEGEGWDGPAVVAWSHAIADAKNLLGIIKDDNA